MGMEQGAQLVQRQAADGLAHDPIDRLPVLDARRVVDKARILDKMLQAERRAKPLEYALRRALDRGPLAGGRRVDVAGGGILAAIAAGSPPRAELVIFD